ncbi:Insulin-induced protein (INSIG) family protein [Candida albicans]|uniref:Insulin-induced protein (INSIG) family protein n=1 Tax=Candida albicans TaxID=5476 RepID=A0A8H6F5S1_CANAX|nr:Insulin-induced protein (INSIG) family protein [Candida albicans]
MAELRKIALSNSNLKNMASPSSSTPGSSGASSPQGNGMAKTDSLVNLTQPELYGIFRNDSNTSLSKEFEEDSAEIEFKVNSRLNKSTATTTTSSSSSSEAKYSKNEDFEKYLPLPLKIVVLTLASFIYNEVTSQINFNHTQSNYPLTIKHLFKISSYIHLDEYLAFVGQRLVMASFHPILDYYLPKSLTKRLLSSNPNPSSSTSYSTLINDLIRSSVAFLGVSYAIRNIEWSSFLQVAIIYSLVSPGLWLLLDGTISGLIGSLVVSIAACSVVYYQNYQYLNGVVFGKLGRFLFQ